MTSTSWSSAHRRARTPRSRQRLWTPACTSWSTSPSLSPQPRARRDRRSCCGRRPPRHGLPEPPLGRRLPDRAATARRGRARAGPSLRVAVRVVEARSARFLEDGRDRRGGRRHPLRPRHARDRSGRPAVRRGRGRPGGTRCRPAWSGRGRRRLRGAPSPFGGSGRTCGWGRSSPRPAHASASSGPPAPTPRGDSTARSPRSKPVPIPVTRGSAGVTRPAGARSASTARRKPSRWPTATTPPSPASWRPPSTTAVRHRSILTDAIAVLEIIEAVHAAAAPHERTTPEQKEQTA